MGRHCPVELSSRHGLRIRNEQSDTVPIVGVYRDYTYRALWLTETKSTVEKACFEPCRFSTAKQSGSMGIKTRFHGWNVDGRPRAERASSGYQKSGSGAV